MSNGFNINWVGLVSGLPSLIITYHYHAFCLRSVVGDAMIVGEARDVFGGKAKAKIPKTSDFRRTTWSAGGRGVGVCGWRWIFFVGKLELFPFFRRHFPPSFPHSINKSHPAHCHCRCQTHCQAAATKLLRPIAKLLPNK